MDKSLKIAVIKKLIEKISQLPEDNTTANFDIYLTPKAFSKSRKAKKPSFKEPYGNAKIKRGKPKYAKSIFKNTE